MPTISAEARIIASFTLVATLVLGGWNQLAQLGRELLGASVPERGPEIIVTLGILLVVAATAIVANREAQPTTAEWARHLAGATVVLAALIGVAGTIYLLTTAV